MPSLENSNKLKNREEKTAIKEDDLVLDSTEVYNLKGSWNKAWTNPFVVRNIMEFMTLRRLFKLRCINQMTLRVCDHLIEKRVVGAPFTLVEERNVNNTKSRRLKQDQSCPLDIRLYSFPTYPLYCVASGQLNDPFPLNSSIEQARFHFRQMWSIPNSTLNELNHLPLKAYSLHFRVCEILFETLRRIVMTQLKTREIIYRFTLRCGTSHLWKALARYSGYILTEDSDPIGLISTVPRVLSRHRKAAALYMLDCLPYASYQKIFTNPNSQHLVDNVFKVIFYWCRSILFTHDIR